MVEGSFRILGTHLISSLYIINRKVDYYPFADTSFPHMENAKAPYMQEWQHYTCAKPKREPYLCNGPFDFLAWLFGIMEFGQRKEFFLRGNKR